MANSDYDVVIVGAGGAGLAAAHGAAEQGARVLLLEAGDRPGGSLALSGGVFYAANTSVQRAAGITTDTPDAMFRYYMATNHYKLDSAVIRRLCDEATPVFEWLLSIGVEFPQSQLFGAGLDSVKRGHRAGGLGKQIAEALEGALGRHDKVDIALRSRVTELVRDASGAVAGVRLNGETVSAGAVVLASGGIGGSKEMVSRYLPRTSIYGDWVWYIGAPTNRGDGVAMGLFAGGVVTGIDTGSIMMTPAFGNDFEPYIPGWLVFVSHEGRRFADETIDYAVSSNLVRDLPGGECFALLDEATRTAPRAGNMASKDQKNAYPFASWTADRLERMTKTGKLFSANTIAELAENAGINAERLQHTVEVYNRDCAAGHDSQFGKSKELLQPIAKPPFYAARLRPAVIGVTGAGLRTDADARVLDAFDRPIAGLYAAGETVGGIHGELYVGGGGMIANAIVYGRIAGANAARR